MDATLIMVATWAELLTRPYGWRFLDSGLSASDSVSKAFHGAILILQNHS